MDDSLALELPSNGTGFCNGSTEFREGGTHFWARTIAIVSEGLDKNSNSVTGVALVVHFLVDNPFEFTSAPLDSPLNRVDRNRGVSGFAGNSARGDVRDALLGLGYGPEEVARVLSELPEATDTSDLLRQALQRLAAA